MRDILFKAISNDFSPNRWVVGDLSRHSGGRSNKMTAYITHPYLGVSTPINMNTVCEFAGQNDCEGSPIFEHDIVLVNNQWIGEVLFLEGAFLLCKGNRSASPSGDEDDERTCYLFSDGNKYLVTGNVFDHMVKEESGEYKQ